MRSRRTDADLLVRLCEGNLALSFFDLSRLEHSWECGFVCFGGFELPVYLQYGNATWFVCGEVLWAVTP